MTQLDPASGVTDHRFPVFLSDGVHFLFLARRSPAERSTIVLASLASSETHPLVETPGKPGFLAPDLLVFVRGDVLVAERIDLGRGALTGASTSIAEPIYLNDANGAAAFSLSDTGVIAYRSGSYVMRELAWVERGGKVLETLGGAARYQNPRLSPDGRWLAVFRPENGGDVWVTDLDRKTSTRFTLDPASDDIPLWSPDGSRIAFVSDRNGGIFNIYEKSAGGTGALRRRRSAVEARPVDASARWRSQALQAPSHAVQ